MTDSNNLFNFLTSYNSTVSELVELLADQLKIENVMDWRSAGVAQMGSFGSNQQYKYSFHGIGCTVTHKDMEIDFDFGYDGRVGGFEVWKLWGYAKYGTEEFSEYSDKKKLEHDFNIAAQNGLIKQIHLNQGDTLYYLNESKHN